jgi:Transposase IS66 family
LPDVAGVPSPEELASLPPAELAVRLAEAYRLIAGLTGQAERLSARAEELERQARKDSSTSDAAVPDDLVTRYRAPAASGLAANLYRRTATASDARRIARRFRSFEDMILRFATRPDLDIFSNNEAGQTIRPVKVQQRGSGGCWRTLTGLADFALTESHLSTAAKWAISKPDALRDLFNGNAWMPPGLEPAG